MAVFHDEVEIEDFQYDEDSETYFYPCPCGDNFCITKEDLENGEDVATCPSCSLIIKVIYDKFLLKSVPCNESGLNSGVLEVTSLRKGRFLEKRCQPCCSYSHQFPSTSETDRAGTSPALMQRARVVLGFNDLL
ncbi:diphthamide biosynthesis protein 3 isoform X1 [Sagmatias obliquidens]|uniref:diphthamide biosynthesis protein 3 isoform X1 n=1 Tax=Sagmatias obliquidens TaxID=3371155 RepID=UPI000F4462B7|nr:DPH3 homolog isoform X1 [Lagenorhynchus obliquidens]